MHDILEFERDLDYFGRLWEQHKQKSPSRSTKNWDSRADNWAQLLENDSLFRRGMEGRVQESAAYLRAQGLLGPDSEVVDIGCGPGRFVVEFARTAGRVTGLDLSPRMCELGAQYAAEQGLSNTVFHACDFKATDIDAASWAGKFDLVFTSITPAVGTLDGLHKAMRMSRGHVFNSCFIHWHDELEQRIGREVFGRVHERPMWNGRWYYALFNLLWLEGYYPVTHYHDQSFRERVPVNDELIAYYAKSFAQSEDAAALEDARARVRAFLEADADAAGTVMQHTLRRYGWMLWEVTKRDARQ